MNFVRFSAGPARCGRSRAVARTAARRRFAVFSVALAAVLASIVVTTGPASAGILPGLCLDADAQQVGQGGAIIQWDCDTTDNYQRWVNEPGPTTSSGVVYQLEVLGPLDDKHENFCLDANAQEVYPGGAIVQWVGNNNDPYQWWLEHYLGGGVWSFQNYGALMYQNSADCLDVDAQHLGDLGPIVQWGCNSNDVYQEWEEESSPLGGTVFPNLGAALATSGGV
jgi:hypothetical protein